jgi:3'(2'), 5'-bisphosphate nucleotidase
MDTQKLKTLLEEVIPIAEKAAQAILEVVAKTGQESTPVEDKADGSPVTMADKAAHNTIVPALQQLTPDVLVVSEEAYLEKSERKPRQLYWLVDPLDGTKEFIKGLGDYTVNIALIENGMSILGVIYVPAQKTLYYAASNLGAFKQTTDSKPARISANQSDRSKIAVVSRSHLNEATKKFLEDRQIDNVIQRGSSVKICAVAEGSADIYPRLAPTYLWDTAAGAIVAREAGCEIKTPQGNDLLYQLDKGLKHNGFIVYAKKIQTSEVFPCD